MDNSSSNSDSKPKTKPSNGKGYQGELYMNRSDLEEFKDIYRRAYIQHDGNMDSVFTFHGMKFVLGYARYMIEYLEERFKKE